MRNFFDLLKKDGKLQMKPFFSILIKLAQIDFIFHRSVCFEKSVANEYKLPKRFCDSCKAQ